MSAPFIEGTNIQFAWDSTSLGWLKECPRKYQLHMIEGWLSRGESIHLTFGKFYHSALEVYDKAQAEGIEHEQAMLAAVRHAWNDSLEWKSDDKYKNRKTLIRSIIWYLDEFEKDAAATVILKNGKAAVELSFRMELDYGPGHTNNGRRFILRGKDVQDVTSINYVLCGHLDRVVSYLGSSYVTDRKTTSAYLGPEYFARYEPDNQMSLYTLGGRVIFESPIRGVMIDAAQLQVQGTQFARGFTYRTDGQLNEWMNDLRYWLSQAEQFANANYWPMNDKSCHNYGGCPFRKVCGKDPSVRETFLKSDFEKRQWNPLEIR